MPHIAAIIQARTGSTRLPEKVLLPLAGRPVIEHIINRIQSVNEIDEIVLAIPSSPSEKPLERIAERMEIKCIPGPEEDVLKRFIQAGISCGAEHIVRICADNPLIDLNLIQSLINQHSRQGADFTFCADAIPLGTGGEVVKLSALKKIAQKTRQPIYLEHVTTYFHDHPEAFHLERVPAPPYLNTGKFRLTLDTEKDFHLLNEIYQKFYFPTQSPLNLEEVVHFLAANPKLASYNADVAQKNWRKGEK